MYVGEEQIFGNYNGEPTIATDYDWEQRFIGTELDRQRLEAMEREWAYDYENDVALQGVGGTIYPVPESYKMPEQYAFYDDYGNYYDDKINELYDKLNSRQNISAEVNAELQKYLIENFYVYGTLEGISIDCWRNSVVANATTKTFRTWMIPGAWVYTE